MIDWYFAFKKSSLLFVIFKGSEGELNKKKNDIHDFYFIERILIRNITPLLDN